MEFRHEDALDASGGVMWEPPQPTMVLVEEPKMPEQGREPTLAEMLLLNAATTIAGPREREHGNKAASFTGIATMWTAYLASRKEGAWAPVRPVDVAHMMVLLKQQRAEWGEALRDHYLDAAGYQAIAWEVLKAEIETNGI